MILVGILRSPIKLADRSELAGRSELAELTRILVGFST